jgi:hypothetical protein
MTELTHLKGKTAFITGASSGIGKEFAMQLAENGMHLLLVARRQTNLSNLKDELKKNFKVSVQILSLDLRREDSITDALTAATSYGGDLRVFVNNAGVGATGNFLEESYENHRSLLALNVYAYTELLWGVARHMQFNGKRSYIVNVGSIAGYHSIPNPAIYGSSKAYVRLLSESLGYELRQSNVTITHVSPGRVSTEFSKNLGRREGCWARSGTISVGRVVSSALRGMSIGKERVIPGMRSFLKSIVLHHYSKSVAKYVGIRL